MAEKKLVVCTSCGCRVRFRDYIWRDFAVKPDGTVEKGVLDCDAVEELDESFGLVCGCDDGFMRNEEGDVLHDDDIPRLIEEGRLRVETVPDEPAKKRTKRKKK